MMVNRTLSPAPATPVTDTATGVTFKGPAAALAIMVMVALAVPATLSDTFSVTEPVATFAGKLTVMGVPDHIPSPAAVSKAFVGSVEVVI